MLVLDRKIREGFWIEDRIFVKVLSIGKHRVKIGIEAPSDLRIVREELRSIDGNQAPSRNSQRNADSLNQSGDPSG